MQMGCFLQNCYNHRNNELIICNQEYLDYIYIYIYIYIIMNIFIYSHILILLLEDIKSSLFIVLYRFFFLI